MNRILCTTLILTFVICLSSIYAENDLFACGGGGCSEKKEGLNGANVYSDKAVNEIKGEIPDIVKDPVCGMEVHNLKISQSSVYKGSDYYFCSDHCKQAFKNDPESYISTLTHQHGEG